MNRQFAFREGIAHQTHVNILLDLLETVLVTQRVEEGDIRRIRPDLGSESGVCGINRSRIVLNHAPDHTAVGGCFRWRNVSGPAFFCFCACRRGSRHDLFDFTRISGEAFAEQPVAGFGDQDVVFDAHAKILFGDVDAWLNGDDHAGLERGAVFARVVNIEADMMAEAVNEIGAKWLIVEILAMGIYVIVGNFVDALVALDTEVHSGL